MPDYRDPKVTTTSRSGGGGMGRWIGIALAAIVILLLLAWLFGLFGADDEVAVETLEPATTVEDLQVEGAPLEGAGDVTVVDETPVEVDDGEVVDAPVVVEEGDAVVTPVE